MKTKETHNPQFVDQHIQKYDISLQNIINRIRTTILSIDNEIGEQIKWNSPSFFYLGDMKPFDLKEYKRDIVVLNLHKGSVLMVFPTGAKVNDTTGIVEGNYNDGRRMIKITDMTDLNKKEAALRLVISEWLKLIEK
jgi:hypothetical protein